MKKKPEKKPPFIPVEKQMNGMEMSALIGGEMPSQANCLLEVAAMQCDGRKRDRERPRATSDIPPIPKPHAKKVYIRFRFHYLKGGRLD